MNTIEDRLRAATRAAADTVSDYSQPPLRLPARTRGYSRPRLGIAAPRLIASVATAAAIVAVVATVAVTRDVTAGHRSAPGQSTGAITTTVPPFFVATTATDAVIARTATGKVLATVTPPAPYNAFTAVSAAADDRTFVLAAEKLTRPDWHGDLSNPNPVRFYLLHLRPGRRLPATLTALPIPVLHTQLLGTALSPSGTRLAVVLEQISAKDPTYLRVYNLASGQARTWSLPAAQRSVFPGIMTPSWDAGNRFIATLVDSSASKSCRSGCVQLLDTTKGGGNILTASKTIFATATIHLAAAAWLRVLVTPDGSRLLLTGSIDIAPSGQKISTLPLLYSIASQSGHVLSHQTGRSGTDPRPLWASDRAALTILGEPDQHGLTAAWISSRHRRVVLHLPAHTLQAAW
jgi:hypothetical protein